MLTAFVLRWRLGFLVATGIATLLLGFSAVRIGVEESNESMNAIGRQSAKTYQRFRRDFGNDNDLVLTLTHPNLLDPTLLPAIDTITAQIQQLDGVRRVYSLATAVELVATAGGSEPRRLMAEGPEGLEAALNRNEDFTGQLVSQDRNTAAFIVELEERPNDSLYLAKIVDHLRNLAAPLNDSRYEFHLAGIEAQKLDVSRLLARDQMLLIPMVVVALACVLAFFFRSPAAVGLPLICTGITVTWTMGAYGLAGFSIHALTALLAPTVMAISVATCVHIYHGWLTWPDPSVDSERVLGSVNRLRRPCFFTALTTAIGFGSLGWSATPAVGQFGIFAALGAILAYLVAVTVLPVALSFLPAPAPQTRGVKPGRAMHAFLKGSSELAVNRPRHVLMVAAALSLAAVALLPSLRNNTDLIGFMKESAPLSRDTAFIDKALNGSAALEFVIRAPAGKTLDNAASLAGLLRLRQIVEENSEVTATLSILDVLAQVHRAETEEEPWNHASLVPENEDQLLYELELMRAAQDQSLINRLVDPNWSALRLTARTHAMGSQDAIRLADQIVAQAHPVHTRDSSPPPLEVTGAFFQMASDSNDLVRDQLRSFGLALVLIVAVIAFLFRSPQLVVAAVAPNLLPILWTCALMAALGIELSTGTAMIASVLIGISVDDTIHYLDRLRQYDLGEPAKAIRAATLKTGATLSVTSVVLVLGFWAGALGSFKPTIYFSLLTGTAMITALLCDLLVLPAAVMLLFGGRKD